MAASDVAAPLNLVNNKANGTMSAANAGVSPFEPSVWGDFFAHYTNPISKARIHIESWHAHVLS